MGQRNAVVSHATNARNASRLASTAVPARGWSSPNVAPWHGER
jgi:hypothetical protein